MIINGFKIYRNIKKKLVGKNCTYYNNINNSQIIIQHNISYNNNNANTVNTYQQQ